MDKRKAVEPARNDPKKWSSMIMSHILWVIISDKVLLLAPKVLFKVLFIQLADETNSNSFGTKPVKYYTITTLVHQHLAPPLFQMMTYTNPDWLTPTH